MYMQDIVNSYKDLSLLFIEIWAHFADEEKCFLFDHVSSTYYIGIKRKNIHDAAILAHEPFVFYPFEFFTESVNTHANEHAICFEYFFVVKNNIILYNSLPQSFYASPFKDTFQNNFQKLALKTIHHTDDYANWESLFNTIQEEIQVKRVTKVVASRKVKFQADTKIDTASILLQLFKNNPHTYIFASHLEGQTFLGASPELLVEKKSSQIKSFAIAGTISKNHANREEQGNKLLLDDKNQFEHAIVVQSIQNSMETMRLNCSQHKKAKDIIRSETSLMELKNLFHLKTMLCVEDDTNTLLDYVNCLHPTPAMGGAPKELALALIKQHEKHDRKFYAAPFGIIEKNANGIFIVGIRSALVQGNTLYAYAGCGIVEQSNCLEEYEEINNKLQTILECFEG